MEEKKKIQTPFSLPALFTPADRLSAVWCAFQRVALSARSLSSLRELGESTPRLDTLPEREEDGDGDRERERERSH